MPVIRLSCSNNVTKSPSFVLLGYSSIAYVISKTCIPLRQHVHMYLFPFLIFLNIKKPPSVLASHVPVHSHRLDLLALSFEVAWRMSSYPSLMPSVISKMIVVHTQIVSVVVFFLPKIYLYIFTTMSPCCSHCMTSSRGVPTRCSLPVAFSLRSRRGRS